MENCVCDPTWGQFSGGKLAAAAAAVAAAAAATGQVVPTSLSMQTMPIIPMARTQLEELVKNLDAELVLDVVSKKMFDNFSIWDLQVCSITFCYYSFQLFWQDIEHFWLQEQSDTLLPRLQKGSYKKISNKPKILLLIQ